MCWCTTLPAPPTFQNLRSSLGRFSHTCAQRWDFLYAVGNVFVAKDFVHLYQSMGAYANNCTPNDTTSIPKCAFTYANARLCVQKVMHFWYLGHNFVPPILIQTFHLLACGPDLVHWPNPTAQGWPRWGPILPTSCTTLLPPLWHTSVPRHTLWESLS